MLDALSPTKDKEITIEPLIFAFFYVKLFARKKSCVSYSAAWKIDKLKVHLTLIQVNKRLFLILKNFDL